MRFASGPGGGTYRSLGVESSHLGDLRSLVQDLAASGRATVTTVEPLDEDLSSVFAYLVD